MTPLSCIRISSNIDSGTGPLNISLRLDGSFPISTPAITYTGLAPITLTPGDTSTELSALLTAEGMYVITATAQAPDGQTYSDSITVTVISRYQLEALLKGKWEGMKAKIAAGDVENVVQNFITSKQQDFRDTFTEVGVALPQLANYMSPVELVYMNDDMAKCRMTRTEFISGEPQTVEYVVYFIQENGVWKLRDF